MLGISHRICTRHPKLHQITILDWTNGLIDMINLLFDVGRHAPTQACARSCARKMAAILFLKGCLRGSHGRVGDSPVESQPPLVLAFRSIRFKEGLLKRAS
jgi:hypothetical protein